MQIDLQDTEPGCGQRARLQRGHAARFVHLLGKRVNVNDPPVHRPALGRMEKAKALPGWRTGRGKENTLLHWNGLGRDQAASFAATKSLSEPTVAKVSPSISSSSTLTPS